MTKDFDIYKNFPTDVSYKIFLYNLKLKNSLICPYCYSDKISTYNDLFH
ncbi:transposase, partial [Clostridioides difficile]|nr:transposase [Clostridioides difficile]